MDVKQDARIVYFGIKSVNTDETQSLISCLSRKQARS